MALLQLVLAWARDDNVVGAGAEEVIAGIHVVGVVDVCCTALVTPVV